MVQHTYNDGPIESRIWSIERRHFQWRWTTPSSRFRATPFFDAEYLRNGTRYRHNFNRILIGTWLHTPYSTVSFRMTLSDLEWVAKYSMTRSVSRSVCDSWSSCSITDVSWSKYVHCKYVKHLHIDGTKITTERHKSTILGWSTVQTVDNFCDITQMTFTNLSGSVYVIEVFILRLSEGTELITPTAYIKV